MDLLKRKCVPCEGIGRAFDEKEARKLLGQVEGWEMVFEGTWKIKKNFPFKNFQEALAFVNRVGALAEEENHHPDILLHSWNNVTLSLSTHALKGLTENDFILAAKADALKK